MSSKPRTARGRLIGASTSVRGRSSTLEHLQLGLDLHRAGRLQEAKQWYQKVLSDEPKHFDALQLSAALETQLGNHAIALSLFEVALALNPRKAALHNNLGFTLRALKRLEQARASFEQALLMDPQLTDACLNLGLTLHDLGRFDEAVGMFSRAIALNPAHVDAHFKKGNSLRALRRFEEALVCFSNVIHLNPDHAEAHFNCGNALFRLHRFHDALLSYEEAIRIKPEYSSAINNSGLTLYELGRVDEALTCYSKALQINPLEAEYFINHGNALKKINRYDEALTSYAEAIRLDPASADAYVNQGVAYHDLLRFDEAIASYSEALEVNPACADAFYNRGNVQRDFGLFENALQSYSQALRIEPDNALAIHNRALLNLRLRRFGDGFHDYLRRWELKEFPTARLKTNIPACKPDSLQGKILVWAEQGLGDEVLYASLLPELLKREVSLTLSADVRLHPVYRRSFPTLRLLDRKELSRYSTDSGYDSQAPIGDLAYLLSADEAFVRGSRSNYLRPNLALGQRMRALQPWADADVVCGIAWRSANPRFGNDKSMPLIDMVSALRNPAVSFVNLQYGAVQNDIQIVRKRLGVEVHEVEGLDIFNDIESLMALISVCDIVVTTSNVTAHLAGSMGKRAAVLVPMDKGRIWYWHDHDDHSLWYPSLRLFFQEHPTGWTKPLQTCAEWIRSTP
jgi:tetratricopeptide (TPR) repeat protein